MSLSLDHVVLSVTDLTAAMTDFSNAGFTVAYGGKHADGMTENALILFADGSYLELLALTANHQREEAAFKQLLHETGEGYTGYALSSTALVDDLNAIEARGLYVSPIRQGGRARPDGVVLQWQMAQLDNAMTPFVIQDMSPREWRVPAVGEAIVHGNGALGISAFNFHCHNYDASVAWYAAVTGQAAEESATYSRFRIGTTDILLYRHPEYQSERHESLVSLGIAKLSSIPQRLSVRGMVFVLVQAT